MFEFLLKYKVGVSKYVYARKFLMENYTAQT